MQTHRTDWNARLCAKSEFLHDIWCISGNEVRYFQREYFHFSVGVLTQGGGVFGTFVSSFYLQFSQDGKQWYTYKELVTDARPRAKVRHQIKSMQLYIIYIQCHLPLLFLDLATDDYHSPSRFFMVTKMIEGWQRPDWTGWYRLSLSACCHTTSRMASTFDLRSWAVEMVSRLMLV